MRDHQPIFPADFRRLTRFDRVAFEHLFLVCNRPIARGEDTAEPLKVQRQTKGIQWVEGVFVPADPPDEYLYHVARKRWMRQIQASGFAPSLGYRPQTMTGELAEYAKDKVFFCDRPGVLYWKTRITSEIARETGEVPLLAVLRVRKDSVTGMVDDARGTAESLARSWYTTDWVKPQE